MAAGHDNLRLLPNEREENWSVPPRKSAQQSAGRYLRKLMQTVLKNVDASIHGVLNTLLIINGNRKVRWADVGAGYAIPMRQVKKEVKKIDDLVEMTGWIWSIGPLLQTRPIAVQKRWMLTSSGVLRGLDLSRVLRKMHLLTVVEDATKVKFENPQDLFTLSDSLYYIPDKLGALTNLYNQLAPWGLMLVRAHNMGSLFKSEDSKTANPFRDFLEQLRAAGAQVYTSRYILPNAKTAPADISIGAFLLVIQKPPQDHGPLVMNQRLVQTEKHGDGIVISHYTTPGKQK